MLGGGFCEKLVICAKKLAFVYFGACGDAYDFL